MFRLLNGTEMSGAEVGGGGGGKRRKKKKKKKKKKILKTLF